MTTHALSAETALGIINGHLGIQASVTARGDEVKCYTPDPDEGVVSKDYFDSKDCFELAECFEALGAALRVGTDRRATHMTTPEIRAYMPANNGGRRRSFEVDGVTVYVEPHEDDERGRAVAEMLAGAPSTLSALRHEVQRLRAEVPPRDPVRLIGPGCVRFRDGKLWLLNKREKGWASFGLCLESWDDLFRRFNAIVVEHGSDAFGDYWTVDSPQRSEEGGSNG